MSRSLPLLDLIPDLKRIGSSRGGSEYHGPCPFCGGDDRFIVWPEQGNTGRYWCRQCNRKGDTIQFLRDRDGCSFAEAKRQLGLSTDPPSREATRRQRAQRHALAAAQQAFADWSREKMTALTDQYRALMVRRDELIEHYRHIGALSEEEARQVVTDLGQLYGRLAPLEYNLDILTYQKHEAERAQWWRSEEVEDGSRIAA